MRWYKKLYLGTDAKKSKYKIIGKVRTRKFQIDTYLITLSQTEGNLLDIYQANFLLQPRFKKAHVLDDVCVVGIAKGRDEAYDVVERIISDVYSATGGFALKEYYGL